MLLSNSQEDNNRTVNVPGMLLIVSDKQDSSVLWHVRYNDTAVPGGAEQVLLRNDVAYLSSIQVWVWTSLVYAPATGVW